MLGWDAAGKIRALTAAENALLPQLAELTAAATPSAPSGPAPSAAATLAQLSAYDSWRALDWQGAIRQIAELGRERDLLIAASGVLFGLDGAMDDVRRDIVSLATAQATLQQRRGRGRLRPGETFSCWRGCAAGWRLGRAPRPPTSRPRSWRVDDAPRSPARCASTGR